MSAVQQVAPAEGAALPSGWSVRPLEAIADIERAGVRPEDIKAGTLFVGLEHIEAGGRILGVETVTSGDIASTKFGFDEGHVLYGKLRPYLSKIALPDFAGICSTDILPIRPGPDLDRSYLAHFLRQPKMVRHAASRASGANLPRLSPTVLGTFPVPLPPLAEQERIAGILDAADRLRAKRRESIALLDTLIQSIFLDMFGDPLANPRGWPTATVGDIAERVTDGEHKTPRRSKAGVPLLSARNIRDGWIDFQNTDFVDEEEYANLVRRIEPKPGDVLISCSGTIGRVAQVRGLSRFAMVRSAALVRPGPAVDSTFLAQLLATTSLKAVMTAQANSSAQANLFQNQIRRLPVFLPPADLQKDFTSVLARAESQTATVTTSLAQIDALFASLQSRAFQGEL